MVTRILRIDENNADEVIAQAGEVLKTAVWWHSRQRRCTDSAEMR